MGTGCLICLNSLLSLSRAWYLRRVAEGNHVCLAPTTLYGIPAGTKILAGPSPSRQHGDPTAEAENSNGRTGSQPGEDSSYKAEVPEIYVKYIVQNKPSNKIRKVHCGHVTTTYGNHCKQKGDYRRWTMDQWSIKLWSTECGKRLWPQVV